MVVFSGANAEECLDRVKALSLEMEKRSCSHARKSEARLIFL